MKLLIFFILVIFSCQKVPPEDLFFPILKNDFDWRKIEKSNHKVIEDFFKIPREESGDGYKFTNDSNLQKLHILDFNNDGLDDILIDQFFGEHRCFLIYLNVDGKFNKIFSELFNTISLEFNNNRLSKIYLHFEGCCNDDRIINKVYNLDYLQIEPKISLSKSMQFFYNTELPIKYFKEKIKFTILYDNYNIRRSPIINDSTEMRRDSILGNTLGKIPSGSIGYALAEKVDKTGRIWWFSAFAPEVEIKDSEYMDGEGVPKSYKLGWVSSKYVKEIE